MFSTSILNITITSFIDKRRLLADGMYPVRIRVNQKRIRQHYLTGVTMTDIDWMRLPVAKSKELIRQKDLIQIAFNHIRDAVNELVKEDNFSFDQLNIRLGKGIDATVNIAFKARIERSEFEEKYSSAELCMYSLRSIEAFAGEKIAFSQITVDWLKRFEKFLTSKGKSYTTISMYMRQLQAVINEAKKVGVIKTHQYPFGVGKYEIPQHSGRNMALTIAQIKEIFSYDCHDKTLEFRRDLWIFSYLCNGANVADICNMKYENIRNGNIQFYRQKTITKSKIKKAILVCITDRIQEIIDKWGNKPMSLDTYIFPILTGDETAFERRKKVKAFTYSLNHYMQKIGRVVGIGHITTYTARHSFATVLKRSGTNIAFISESLGHSDIKVTENYLASFEDEERRKNAELLTNF